MKKFKTLAIGCALFVPVAFMICSNNAWLFVACGFYCMALYVTRKLKFWRDFANVMDEILTNIEKQYNNYNI